MRHHQTSALVLAAVICLTCGAPEDSTAPDPAGLGPEGEPTGEPVRGDWLVLWQLSDPESLNPLTSSDAGASQVLQWIFPKLLRLDEESFEMAPHLAREMPEVSDDKLTYTFRLREGLTFSDGQPVTAEDLIFALKATKHPKVNAPHARNYLLSVKDAVALDPLTVRIDLGQVYFRNIYTLGSLEPLPRHYYDPEGLLEDLSVAQIAAWDDLTAQQRERAERFAKAFNEDFHRNPMGPGAFVLEDPERDWITGERIMLRHRDDFWAPGDSDQGDAWVDRILYRVINDREAALVALKSHSMDVLGLTPIQHLKATGSDRFQREFDKHVELLGGIMYIGWNQQRPVFQDKRVRQALSHLVDKRNIIDKVLFGLGVAIESPIFVKRPEHNDALEPWTYDPERAGELLAEAGWKDTDGDGVLDKEIGGERVPLRFEIISNSGNDERKNVGLVVIDSFKRAGIDASFRGIDWSIMLDKVKKFDYDAVILGWTGSGAVPPDSYQIWHSSQAIGGGSNHIAFKNAEADRILEDYRLEFDPAVRKRLYDRFQEILYDEQPYTFLYTRESITSWDRRFQDVTWYPGLGTNMGEWWVAAASRRHAR